MSYNIIDASLYAALRRAAFSVSTPEPNQTLFTPRCVHTTDFRSLKQPWKEEGEVKMRDDSIYCGWVGGHLRRRVKGAE